MFKKNKTYKRKIKFICIMGLFYALFLVLGCSSERSGSDYPVIPDTDFYLDKLDNLDKLPLSTLDTVSTIDVMGSYELIINPDTLTADLVAKRVTAVGEGYIVSGLNFFTMAPCVDCLQLRGIDYIPNDALVLKFWIRHPFDPGNPNEPPTARNRLDLDVFDLAIVIAPVEATPEIYLLTGASVYTNACIDAHGYTKELQNLLGNDAALPYFLVIDDSKTGTRTWNLFAMGESAECDVKFAIQNQLRFDIYLTMGYGASARQAQRLKPKYFNPEFNRNAAWKVEVIPPEPAEIGSTWEDNDPTTEFDVEVRVYDWQIGATVYNNPADFENAPTDNIYAVSDVALVSVEIPGMTNTLNSVSEHDGNGTGMPDSPLIFKIPIANENGLCAGAYTGLVKVTDTRHTSSPSEERDYLIHTIDGVILDNLYIPEYATYQTFIATIVESVTIEQTTGNLIWAKRAGGSQNDRALAITALSDNSSVATGMFSNTAVFGHGEINETVLVADGAHDIFVARFSPDGSLEWAKRAGGPGFNATSDDHGLAITTLSDDSTVVTGRFFKTAIFGEGEPNETILTARYGSDMFIARYNSNGTLRWAKSAKGNHWDVGSAVTSLSDDSTVVTGAFHSSDIIFGEGEPNEETLSSAGVHDIFIARYNADGTLAWAKRAGGSSDAGSTAIATLPDNSTIVTGYFLGSATFGPGDTNETTLSSQGDRDIYIAKYNADGTLAWAKREGGTDLDTANGIVALSDNSFALSGIFSGTATFGKGESNQTILNSPGDYEIFIAKYNPNGTLAWAKQAGGTNYALSDAISCTWDDAIIITGGFKGTATFGHYEPNQTILHAAGENDIFIAKYNPDGTLLWAKHAPGLGTDRGRGIATLTDNSTVVTGWFVESTTFGPGEPYETELFSDGGWDIFIARFEP